MYDYPLPFFRNRGSFFHPMAHIKRNVYSPSIGSTSSSACKTRCHRGTSQTPAALVYQGLGMYRKGGVTVSTLPETNSSQLKIGPNPKGKDRLPTIHFQVQAVSFREGNQTVSYKNQIHCTGWCEQTPHLVAHLLGFLKENGYPFSVCSSQYAQPSVTRSEP